MKYIKVIILLSSIFLVTGCWNYRELEDLAIVGGVGIDLDGKDLVVSVEILNAKKVASSTGSSSGGSSGSNEAPTVVYQAKGKTIKEALNNITLDSPYKLYIGHMSLLAISDKVAKAGITKIVDYFMRDFESRKIFPVVTIKNGKALDLLKLVTPLETVTANNIQDSLEATAAVSGVVSNRQFDEVLECLYMEGRYPTVTAIEIKNPSKNGQTSENVSSTQAKTSAVVFGSAAFKGDKLVGYLDKKESLGYTIIRDKTQSITISFPCDNKGNYGNVIFDNVSSNIDIKFNKNKPVAYLNVSGDGALAEYNCNTDLLKDKNIDNIKKLTIKEINKIIKKTIDKTQKELKSDILGFGERIYKNYNSYWRKNKKNWDKIFVKMDYKIKTNINVKRIGSTVSSGKEGY